MAEICRKNFADQQPQLQNGDVVERCNLQQVNPHTQIGQGVSGLTFRWCNMVNCAIPLDAVEEDCLRPQISHCSHLHLEFVGRGLPECSVDCVHVVDTDVVTVDGVEVSRFRHYKDTIL